MGKNKVKDFTREYAKKCSSKEKIDLELYDKFGVKKGLRDKNGKGVLSGLTTVSLIKSSEEIDGKTVPNLDLVFSLLRRLFS